MFNIASFDAQAALGFVISQRTHIEPGVYATVYPDVQYSFLVPVDSSAHPFTPTVTYFSSDIYGKAKWINGNADDIPLAGTEMSKFETSVYTAGIGYGYGWEELGAAMQLGRNLTADDAAAARRASEEFIDNVALRGSAEKGFSGGLINHADVTPTNAPNGGWGSGGTGSASDLSAVMEDINAGIVSVFAGTLYTSIADTLLISPEKLLWLSTQQISGTMETFLSFVKKNNAYTAQTGRPLEIRAVRGLSEAGVGDTERLVAYRRSNDVMKLHMPMPHRFLTPFQAGPLRIEVPGVFRLGGLDIRRPAEVRYIDGI